MKSVKQFARPTQFNAKRKEILSTKKSYFIIMNQANLLRRFLGIF